MKENEQQQKPVSAGGMVWVLILVLAGIGALCVAQNKTEKMVANFTDSSVRDKRAIDYPRELEREIAKLESELKILQSNDVPVYRETKAEEQERWEATKHHLYEEIRRLSIQLKDKTEELELARSQVPPEDYSKSESGFVDGLIVESFANNPGGM